MPNRIQQLYGAFRLLGPGFCLYRVGYAFRKKTGLLKRQFPAASWDDITLASLLRPGFACDDETLIEDKMEFFFYKDHPPKINCVDKVKLIEAANCIQENKFRYFFSSEVDLGHPVNWFYNPSTNASFPNPNRHWCDIDFFDSGDIKYIWEPSRFGWAYVLARAYALAQDETYAETFFELFESWLQANPYNIGPNFACGQECAIRLMAMVFALHALAASQAITPERQSKLIKVIGLHAQRVYDNLDFAISTRTNHSITEAAGLYTAGLLFPEFKNAKMWLTRGRQTLIKEGLKQIYEDGSYIQHSMNYHRLMLQDYLWCLQLARKNNESFPEALTLRVQKAVDFLYQMTDPHTGRVPNYGANDGALIMPLSSCDYLDFRPVLQSGGVYFHRAKMFGDGPWNEEMHWLFGDRAKDAPSLDAKPISSRFDAGGYYTLRNTESWGMLRCHSYKDRPGHADLLHLDLWFKGVNILRDSGTYQYNCPQPWQEYFPSTAAHNTIQLAGQNQMPKLGRFMWGARPQGHVDVFKPSTDSQFGAVKARHFAYCGSVEGAVHERTVVAMPGDTWIIVDKIYGKGTVKTELFWQLADVPCTLKGQEITLDLPTGKAKIQICALQELSVDLHTGSAAPAGWQSLYYGRKTPAPTVRCAGTMQLPCTILTALFCRQENGHCVLSDANTIVMDKNGVAPYTIKIDQDIQLLKNHPSIA